MIGIAEGCARVDAIFGKCPLILVILSFVVLSLVSKNKMCDRHLLHLKKKKKKGARKVGNVYKKRFFYCL